jgi:hypothetical protein
MIYVSTKRLVPGYDSWSAKLKLCVCVSWEEGVGTNKVTTTTDFYLLPILQKGHFLLWHKNGLIKQF